MKIKILLLAIALGVSTLFTTQAVFAQENPSTSFQVDHVARGFEKIKERVTLFFKFSKDSKLDYLAYLSEKRLAELEYGVNNDVNLIEETASRYTTYQGKLSEFVISNKMSDKKDPLSKMYSNHIAVLEKLQSKFEYDSGWWLSIQHGINVNKEFKEKLSTI